MSDNYCMEIMGLLSHLSIDELKDILNDENKFNEITKDCNGQEIANTDKDILAVSNASLFEYIKTNMKTFHMLKSEDAQLYEESVAKFKMMETKLGSLKEKKNRFDSASTITLLQSAVNEIDKETEYLSESFLNEEIQLEEFLNEYINKRKLLYMRKYKMEKFIEITNRRSSYKPAPSPPTRSTRDSYQQNNNFSYPQQSNVPYPVVPNFMPMPGSFMPNHF